MKLQDARERPRNGSVGRRPSPGAAVKGDLRAPLASDLARPSLVQNTQAARRAAKREARPSLAESLRYEGPFWVLFAILTVLPSSQTPWFAFEGVRLSSKDLGILLVALGYGAHLVLTGGKGGQGHERARVVLAGFLGLLAYAAVSMLWGSASGRDVLAMGLTLVLAAAPAVVGYSLTARTDRESAKAFVGRLVMNLCLVAVLYSAESFLSLGLRSEGAGDAGDFGVQRVRGPAFGSSTGHFVLIPALAFALQQFIEGRQRLKHFVLSLVLVLTTLGMGSRSGLGVLALFVLAAVAVTPGARRRAALIGGLLVALLLAGGFVYSRASTERLQSLDDDGRELTHRTVGTMLLERGAAENIFGSGYGSVWPWYNEDTQEGGIPWSGELRHTPYGLVLYHPHSVVLLLAGELGLVGIAFLVLTVGVLGALLLKSRTWGHVSIAVAGVVASLASWPTDLYLFKNYSLDLFWWALLFGVLRVSLPKRGAEGERRAHTANPSERGADADLTRRLGATAP